LLDALRKPRKSPLKNGPRGACQPCRRSRSSPSGSNPVTYHTRFKSLQENIDTTTSGGKLVFHIFGALAEFEREIIKERTRAGLTSARSRGKVGGRPKALTAKEMQILRNMAAGKSLTVSDICKMLGIGRTTFYRYVKAVERE
jgi:DNA invertase Pin-like site-specific DNA recombinase